MNVEAVKWIGGTDGVLELIDQRRLPGEFVKLKVRSVEQLHEAIRTLSGARGAGHRCGGGLWPRSGSCGG